jgi:hypothetical protein
MQWNGMLQLRSNEPGPNCFHICRILVLFAALYDVNKLRTVCANSLQVKG